jgi:hypothetical protein
LQRDQKRASDVKSEWLHCNKRETPATREPKRLREEKQENDRKKEKEKKQKEEEASIGARGRVKDREEKSVTAVHMTADCSCGTAALVWFRMRSPQSSSSVLVVTFRAFAIPRNWT